MKVWRIIIKNSISSIYIKTVEGMSVDIMTYGDSNPYKTLNGKKVILEAFLEKYGIDLRFYINCEFLFKIEKIKQSEGVIKKSYNLFIGL